MYVEILTRIYLTGLTYQLQNQTSEVFRLPFIAKIYDATTQTMQMRIFRAQSRTKFGQGKGHYALHFVSVFTHL